MSTRKFKWRGLDRQLHVVGSRVRLGKSRHPSGKMSEFFLKFYLNSSAFLPCLQRDGRVIQRSSEKKTNEFRIIKKKSLNLV